MSIFETHARYVSLQEHTAAHHKIEAILQIAWQLIDALAKPKDLRAFVPASLGCHFDELGSGIATHDVSEALRVQQLAHVACSLADVEDCRVARHVQETKVTLFTLFLFFSRLWLADCLCDEGRVTKVDEFEEVVVCGRVDPFVKLVNVRLIWVLLNEGLHDLFTCGHLLLLLFLVYSGVYHLV